MYRCINSSLIHIFCRCRFLSHSAEYWFRNLSFGHVYKEAVCDWCWLYLWIICVSGSGLSWILMMNLLEVKYGPLSASAITFSLYDRPLCAPIFAFVVVCIWVYSCVITFSWELFAIWSLFIQILSAIFQNNVINPLNWCAMHFSVLLLLLCLLSFYLFMYISILTPSWLLLSLHSYYESNGITHIDPYVSECVCRFFVLFLYHIPYYGWHTTRTLHRMYATQKIRCIAK